MGEILLHGSSEELVRYTIGHPIDLAIVQASVSGGAGMDGARALLDRGECAVLVRRKRR
jgi:hypothetical protein